MEDLKKEIRNLVAQGKTEEAIEKLLQLAEVLEDTEKANFVLVLKAQFQKYKTDDLIGVLDDSSKSSKLNTIHHSILTSLDRKPTDKQPQTPHQPQTQTSQGSNTSPSSPWKKWLIAISAVVAFLAGIAEFTGINLSTLFGSKPVDSSLQLTVYVHGPKGKQDIVLESQGTIIVDFGNRREKSLIGELGRTNFGEISARFLNETIGLSVAAEGFELADPEAVYIYKGEPIYVEMKAITREGKDPIVGNPIPEGPTQNPIGGGSDTSSNPPPEPPKPSALSYLSRDLSRQSTKPALAIIVVGSGNKIDSDFTSQLEDYYTQQKLSVARGLLKNSFISEGLFANFSQGITDKTIELGFGDHLKKFLLVSKKINYLDPEDGSGQMTAEVSFQFRFVDANSGAIGPSFSLNGRRIGRDKAHAYEGALEWVMKDLPKQSLPF